MTLPIDLQELHLIAVLSLEVLHNLVPFRHELDTILAGRHKEVDDNVIVACGFHVILEIDWVFNMDAFRALPPVGIHHFLWEFFDSLIIYTNSNTNELKGNRLIFI